MTSGVVSQQRHWTLRNEMRIVFWMRSADASQSSRYTQCWSEQQIAYITLWMHSAFEERIGFVLSLKIALQCPFESNNLQTSY